MALNVSLTQIAQEIKDELEDSEILIPNVVSWLRANIGSINILLAENFEIDPKTLELCPAINIDAKNIFKKYYYANKYYKNKSTSVLNNISGGEISSMRDDVSSITFLNKNETAKVYKSLLEDSRVELNKLVDLYKRNRNLPTEAYSR